MPISSVVVRSLKKGEKGMEGTKRIMEGAPDTVTSCVKRHVYFLEPDARIRTDKAARRGREGLS